MRTNAETLGQFIRRLREAKGLSLRAACDIAGISPPFLSDIELDRRTFSAETLVGIARALKIAPDDLRKRVNEKRVADLRAEIERIEKR